jgi:uncharacterized protein GlcG (DUF336 family)
MRRSLSVRMAFISVLFWVIFSQFSGVMPYVVSAEGGLPLIVESKVVGGIGVSGASGQEDRAVADAGAAALA